MNLSGPSTIKGSSLVHPQLQPTPLTKPPSLDPQSRTQTDHHHHQPDTSSSTYLYRGHRPSSLILDDIDQLTEWRARQRTFDGAYLRTSLACSTYALMILKLFSSEFAAVGLTYALLSIMILFIALLRRKRLNHDLADRHHPISQSASRLHSTSQIVWGRQFRTSGDVVMIVSLSVLGFQICVMKILFEDLF